MLKKICPLFALLALSCLIALPLRVTHAAGTSITLFPLVNLSGGVAVLTAKNPGKHAGTPIDDGIQLSAGGDACVNCSSAITVKLTGGYARLVGTVYSDDGSPGHGDTTFAVKDLSNPAAGIRVLYSMTVGSGDADTFNIDIQGVTSLNLSMVLNNCYYCNGSTLDIVGSVLGAPATFVNAQYPANGSVIPANTAVTFIWNPYGGAYAYSLRVWMVRQHGHTILTGSTRVTYSMIIIAKTQFVWNDKGYLRGIYQYDLMPLNEVGSAIAGWSHPIQFTVQ